MTYTLEKFFKKKSADGKGVETSEERSGNSQI